MTKRRISALDGDYLENVQQPVTSLCQLPDEILVQIFNSLPQNDVLQLMYASSKFKRAGQMRLYRSLILCEKLNDKFFQSIADHRGRTIVSSWPSIVGLFETIYTRIKKDQKQDLDFLGYVNEIASNNVLDSGQIDQFRHLTQTDLGYILKLRQYFDVVIESLPNLKVIYLPKIPLSRFSLMHPDTFKQVHSLCVRLDDSLLDPSVTFPALRQLTLNLWLYPSNYITRDSTRSIRQLLGDSVEGVSHDVFTNTQLLALEINGALGCADKEMEHFIRHFPYHEDFSYRGLMKMGIKRGVAFAESGDIRDLGSTAKYSAGTGLYEQDGVEWDPNVIDDVCQLGSETISLRPPYNDKSETGTASDRDIWSAFKGAVLPNLKKFTVANCTTTALVTDVDDPCILTDLLAPSLVSNHLQEFNVKNCEPSNTHPQYDAYCRTLTSPEFLRCTSLKRLCVGERHDEDFVGHFLEGTASNLTEFKAHVREGMFFRPYPQLARFDLKKFTILQPTEITLMTQRILNAVIVRDYNYTRLLSRLDDQFYTLSKSVTEYINATHRIDDYGQGDGTDLNGEELQRRFIDEVMYLFRRSILTLSCDWQVLGGRPWDECHLQHLNKLEELNFLGFKLDRQDIDCLVGSIRKV